MLGVVFISAALIKAVDPRDAISVFVYLFPETPAVALFGVRALIVFEMTLGGLLLLGVGGRTTLFAAVSVLVVFTGWLTYLAATNASISCGCGVKASWLIPGNERLSAIARNAVLMAVGVFGAMRAPATPVHTRRGIGDHSRLDIVHHQSQSPFGEIDHEHQQTSSV